MVFGVSGAGPLTPSVYPSIVGASISQAKQAMRRLLLGEMRALVKEMHGQDILPSGRSLVETNIPLLSFTRPTQGQLEKVTYELLGRYAQGSMSWIYLMREQASPHNFYVLKRNKNLADLPRFRREAEIGEMRIHEAILPLVDSDFNGNEALQHNKRNGRNGLNTAFRSLPRLVMSS